MAGRENKIYCDNDSKKLYQYILLVNSSLRSSLFSILFVNFNLSVIYLIIQKFGMPVETDKKCEKKEYNINERPTIFVCIIAGYTSAAIPR